VATKLKAAREARGWSQTQLMHALGHRATTRGLVLPGRESLKAQVSRWENGHVVPDAQYRRLLREVYGLNDADLGLVEEIAVLPALTAPNELQDRLAASTAVDAELVSLLQAQTDTVRQLDRRLGAPVLLEQMRGHIAGLVDLLRHAVLAKERKPVAAVLADAAALAGWQSLDVGAHRQAWDYYETAKAAAREAGCSTLLAHAMGEQAYALLDLGDAASGCALLTEAQLEAGTRAPAILKVPTEAAMLPVRRRIRRVDGVKERLR